MLVYIVMDIDEWNDRVELEGVFSTREKAEECIADLLEEMTESLRKEKKKIVLKSWNGNWMLDIL